ncbi:hypothetical protein JCM19235_6629 [Vibrio maritimus]|uniref:Uncharacterized protein n=1 Tax=Vibrio maritimus TaxID=990268 RepID=A0A090RS29_9VIBR|nr:hypothetical protein JCM19235_6629 [Vibrio maritimus]
MRKTVVAASIIGAMTAAAPVLADEGFYLGGRLGAHSSPTPVISLAQNVLIVASVQVSSLVTIGMIILL